MNRAGIVENDDVRTGRAMEVGRLAGLLANLPRDEFGEQYALVVEAAYDKVAQLVTQEQMRLLAGG